MTVANVVVILLGSVAIVACGGGGGAASIAASPAPLKVVTPSPASIPSPKPVPKLVFAEEFDSGPLDRTKWNVEGSAFWVNNEQQAYIDSPETIACDSPAGAGGGALVLRPQYMPGFVTSMGRKTDFVSGRINTSGKFVVTYGKISARIRMPDTAGAWPAFWMLGYGDWPDSGETDIMEYVGVKDWTSAAMHGPGYSGDTPLVRRQSFPAGTDATQWHVYSVERTRDAVIFSVDDSEFYRITKVEVEKFGPWRFDRPQYLILNFALGGIYPNAVNKVTTPYFGLPESGGDAVKAGTAAMEVDWGRVWSADS